MILNGVTENELVLIDVIRFWEEENVREPTNMNL